MRSGMLMVATMQLGGIWTPAVLANTGLWTESYTGSPWVGEASAGASGGRDLAEPTNPPSTSAALNGYTGASFDGTNDRLSSGLTLGDFVGASHWSAWVLFNATTAFTSGGPGTRYLNPGFFVDAPNSYFNVGFSDEGVQAINNAANEVVIACATGAPHLLMARCDGATLELALDSSGWSSVATASIADTTGTPIYSGVRYNGNTTYFNGIVYNKGISDQMYDDATFGLIKAYINTRYALAL
jgi:hypothetical protein